ncbi:hypothetical protein AALB39_04395 [Lachnospiraceae bacterium 54-53]
MPVILNETLEAERVLKSGEVAKNASSTLFLLGKYYRQKCELGKVETEKKLNEFMEANYADYIPALWESVIEDISKKAKKYPLKEFDAVGITKNEMDVIMGTDGLKYQKLLFTMLCHARYYSLISENNNSWVNTSIPELYRLARVTVKHRNDKFLYLNDLEKLGLIEFSKKNTNLNMRITFLDSSEESVLNICDFRELGYEYLNYIGEGNFIRCSECRRLVRKKSNYDRSTKYCSLCSEVVKFNQKKVWDKTKR